MREFISEYLILMLALIGFSFVLVIFLGFMFGPDTLMAQAVASYLRSMIR